MSERKLGIPLPELAGYCRKAAAEGAVLIKNEEQTLPLKKGEKISVFGRCQIEYYRSGTGSGGAVNVPYVKNILEELRKSEEVVVNEALAGLYEARLLDHPFDNGGGGGHASHGSRRKCRLRMRLQKVREKYLTRHCLSLAVLQVKIRIIWHCRAAII